MSALCESAYAIEDIWRRFEQMLQKLRQLTGIQMIILSVLIIAGVMLMGKSQPYRWECAEGEAGPYTFGFLQKGTYTVEYSYSGHATDNMVVVYSDVMAADNGKVGAEYAKEQIGNLGVNYITFTLDEGSYEVGIKLTDHEAGHLHNVFLQSNHLIHRDQVFIAALLFLAAGVLLICFLYVPAEKYTVPMVLVMLGVIASLPMFSESLLRGDDVEFHLTRLEGIYLGMAAGEFPVRITSQQMSGFGNLTATMYPQMFLYLAALLRFAGVSLMVCYKFLCFLINVGTAFAAYYSVKALTKSNRAAMIMAVLYTFSAYRLSNLYHRAALGETLAMVFFPIVIWGVYEILWGKRRWMVLVLGMTGVLGSHVLSVELCALFMLMELVFWLFSRKKEQFVGRLTDGIKAVAVTIVLNASFLVPFLYFSTQPLQCFMLGYDLVYDSVAYFSQMFELLPTVAGVAAGVGSTTGEMPLSIGAVLLLGAIAFVYVQSRENGEKEHEGLGLHCLFYGVIAVLLASWLFPWEQFKNAEIFTALTKSLQYVWRFLAFASVFLSVVAAVAFDKMADAEKEKWVCVVAASMLIVTTWSTFDTLAYHADQYEDKMWLESVADTDSLYAYAVGDEFYPVASGYLRDECELIACYSTDMRFENYSRKGSHIYVEVIPETGAHEDILFPLYYYPGYVVTINGEEVPSFERNALLCVEAPDEPAVVEAYYKGMWFFSVGDMISALTFFGIVCFVIHKNTPVKKRRLEKELSKNV